MMIISRQLLSPVVALTLVVGVLLTAPALAQEVLEYGGVASQSATTAAGAGQTDTGLGATGATRGNQAGGVQRYTPPKPGAPIVLENGARVASVPGGSRLVTPVEDRIMVESRKGVLIRLPQPASSVFVANPEVADVQVKSPTTIYIFGEQPGETALYALSADDTVLFNSIIAVQHNVAQLKQAIDVVLPNAAVKVTSIQGSIILTGVVDSPRAAEDLREITAELLGEDGAVINRVSIQSPNQINLRVRISEMSRDILKQFGFNWQAIILGSDHSFGLARGNPFTGVDPDFGELNSFFGSIRSNDLSFDAVLDILENEGFVTTLAEPNLTALSGQTASFLAGGEFPVPVPQDDNVITIIFKQFGVGLSFTPTVLSDNQINLQVQPEVSQLSQAGSVSIEGFAIPALTTRRAETTVELGSGESFAIAGLLQTDIQRDISKLPGLGDIPVLGALFRSDRFLRQETELVIIVTPYIVNPVNRPQLVSPTDGYRPPSDSQRWLHGGAYEQGGLGEPIVTRDTQGRRLIGPAGFMIN